MSVKSKILCFFRDVLLRFTSYDQDPIFSEFKSKIFIFHKHEAKVVFPNVSSNGEWVWRARFWGAEPQVDKALLNNGFHLVYIDVADLFGNQEAVTLWDAFYKHCKKTYKLKNKVVLEGFSRGGLIVYNWASQNTDKVACIYADAPVCDIKSWPGGLYSGTGSSNDWETCLIKYGLNKNTVLEFKGIPICNCISVAKAKIPVIHVCGDSDKEVPYEENTGKLVEIFNAHGSKIELIMKKGIGHRPHSLVDPKPIVDFILKSTIQKK